MKAEATHRAKLGGTPLASDLEDAETDANLKRLQEPGARDDEDAEDPAAKRRRILEETRDIDADSDPEEDASSEEERWDQVHVHQNRACSPITCSDEDEEDETAELLRELEKIKKERAEQREQEVRRPGCFLACCI